jgi:integrase
MKRKAHISVVAEHVAPLEAGLLCAVGALVQSELPAHGLLSTDLPALVEQAADFAEHDTSASTKRSYAIQFRLFESWCKTTGLPSLPTDPRVVATYITAMAEAGKKISTIELALSAIAQKHRLAGHPWDPHVELRRTRKGIRRERLVAQHKKTPIEDDLLRSLLATCGDDLLGLRDRAMLLVGWVGAFDEAEGLLITLRKSKRDQEGAGLKKGLSRASKETLCPMTALRAWLDAAQITEGAIFRRLGRGNRLGRRLCSQAVANVVKARASQAGLDPKLFAGHSLRSGFVTTAAKHDKPIDAIMRQTGHRSEKQVMTYIRHATVFKKNASKGIL